MSNIHESAATIVCREVFDEASHPSNDEVVDYARRLGIDPVAEPHLLDLAREGLMAALPKGWSPCLHEPSGSYYYCKNSTGTSTWEHPLDARYKELVEHARAGRSRQPSVDDDSKTTAKDLESHEEATLPKEPVSSKVPVLHTKIPTKLAPLRKVGNESTQRRDCKKKHDILASGTSSMVDRASRDYTNLRFQDPKFFESPKLLGSTEREISLRDIVKRSESMSPRHEKDWEQLSSKFSSEENVIDIDKLSVSSLMQHTETKESKEILEKEDPPRQLGHNQKELTLSGGGFIFLKSNRSRDNTPIQDEGKLEDFQVVASVNESCSSIERPKSILRDKLYEDDDRPTEEERKSVRFDLEKDTDNIKFSYTDSEDDDWDSDSEESDTSHREPGESSFVTLKDQCQLLNSQKVSVKEFIPCGDVEKAMTNNAEENSKLVARRFVVQNVSEVEHLNQLTKDDIKDNDYLPRNKFANMKKIDLFSKSDTDSTPRSSGHDDFQSSNLEEIRKSKEMMLQVMKAEDQRAKQDEQRDKGQDYHLIKLRHDLEIVDHELNRKARRGNEKAYTALQGEFDNKLEHMKNQMEISFAEQKLALEQELEAKLDALRQKLAEKEKEEIEKLTAEMEEIRLENLKKVRSDLEICYERERQEILEKLKIELDERKKELLELRNREIKALETEYEKNFDEEKTVKASQRELMLQYNEQIEATKKELEKEFDGIRNDLRKEQREKVTKITEDHEKCLEEILRDFRIDERLARKVYKQRLEEIRADFSRGIDKEAKKMSENATRQETVDFEKIRCEKRLLEDKYKTLKEKYLKLKNDVRLAVERRSKRKEGNTNTSETEKSASTRTRTERTESSNQKALPKNGSSNVRSSEAANPNFTESSDCTGLAGFQRASHGDSRSSNKFESDDATTASETMNSNVIQRRKSFAKKSTTGYKASHNNNSNNNNNNNNSNNNNSTENPVENIRKQLEKLEDLGDQLPSNETAYTLRYPFQDKAPVNASSELEFFRHRIHVERDSVKRARDALRVQKSIFQGRQRAWKQRSARATLEQLVQEERELSDMEVSLHRTRSLLGEKVIHLKHLEQSLDRVANTKIKNENDASPMKNDELTLSDMSSASSGFSSTDIGTDTFPDKPDHYQESTEIIASLENLNSEIREIWGVLNKRQGNNMPPPPTLSYSDLGWLPFHHLTTQPNNVQGFGTPNIQSNILSQLATLPSTTATQNIIAQYGPSSGFTTSVGTVERAPSNLMERTRNMRDWLRQARIETSDIISPGQAPL